MTTDELRETIRELRGAADDIEECLDDEDLDVEAIDMIGDVVFCGFMAIDEFVKESKPKS